MTKKQKLLAEFDNPKTGTIDIYMDVPNCPSYEIIVNSKANFEAKKEYYDTAYNDDLELKTNPLIKIAYWISREWDYSDELKKVIVNEEN